MQNCLSSSSSSRNVFWRCYILTSKKRTKTGKIRTYVGCTKNVERRLRQHNGEVSGGGRYTKRFRPWTVAAVTPHPLMIKTRSMAMQMERYIKRGVGLDGRLKKLSTACRVR